MSKNIISKMAKKQLLLFSILFEFFLHCHCFGLPWGCPPCDYVQCPELDCDPSLQVLEPECGCCFTCTKADGESCGGLSNEQCAPDSICRYRLGAIIGENRTGVCEPGECKRMECNYRRHCGYHPRSEEPLLTCFCPEYRCTGKQNPLCGYDGRTYNSVCLLQLRECVKNTFIGIKHFGACPVTPEPPTVGDKGILTTNALPNNQDDLFGQIIDEEAPTVPQLGCVYQGQNYAPNDMIKISSCSYLHCDENGSLFEIIVPGCPDGPIDPDYGITKPPVHGGWSDWEEGECIGACYGANKTNRRSCTNPAPLHEGRPCSGSSEEVLKCIPEDCGYTCEYSEWSDWSPCSLTCGIGSQSRTRALLVNLTEEQATSCDLTETRSCSIVESCPTTCQRLTLGHERLIDSNGCETVKRWPIYTCDGPCDDDEDCCVVKRTKMRRAAVRCPGVVWFRDSRFDYITECHCNSEDCQLQPL